MYICHIGCRIVYDQARKTIKQSYTIQLVLFHGSMVLLTTEWRKLAIAVFSGKKKNRTHTTLPALALSFGVRHPSTVLHGLGIEINVTIILTRQLQLVRSIFAKWRKHCTVHGELVFHPRPFQGPVRLSQRRHSSHGNNRGIQHGVQQLETDQRSMSMT